MQLAPTSPEPQPQISLDGLGGGSGLVRLFQRLRKMLRHGDLVWTLLIAGMALVILAAMAGIGWSVWIGSAASRAKFGWSFIAPVAEASWDPMNDHFTAWPLITGTLTTALVAILIATPVSIFVAIFLGELCPSRLRSPLNFTVEMLAAVPSVVFGLWGIFVFLPTVVAPVGRFLGSTLGFIPLFRGPIPASGMSRLGAGLVLTIMIIPTISSVSRDVLAAIPRAQREASLALGATRWETIWEILLPYGLSGILGAVILGLGRALGETMAVTMLIGNNPVESSGSLLRPGATMASAIANEFAEAVSVQHTSALIELGLVLFGMTLLLNMAARFLVWRVSRRLTTGGQS
jgi:phosphate transport system permease protein